MIFLPSGSKLELADTCLGSAMGDDGIDTTSLASENGVTIHSFLELCNVHGSVEAALERIDDPAMRAVCEEINLDGLPLDPAAWAAEVTFAWNWRTGVARELGRGLRRDYTGRSPDEIVLTVDAVALVGTDGVMVLDWKTGFSRLRPARRHAQLRMGALAAAAAYGRDRAIVEIIRPREGMRAWRDRAELDAFDLAEVASERRAMAMAIRRHEEEGTSPRLRTGEHCDRCPRRWSCRARTSEIVVFASNPGDVLEQDVLRMLTPETATRAYKRLRTIEAQLKPVKGALRKYAIENPIALEDGLVYGEREVPKPIVDGRAAWDLLEAEHGREVAAAAVEIKTSKTAIMDALRPVAPKRGLSKLHAAVMARLAERGAVTKRIERRVEEHRPREESEGDDVL